MRVGEVGEHFLHDLQRRQTSGHGLRGAPHREGQSSPVDPGQVPQLLSEVRVSRARAVAAVHILRPGEAEEDQNQGAEQSHHLQSQVVPALVKYAMFGF